MELYESPITAEESRNYHSFFYELKALGVRDWIRAYTSTICYIVLLAVVLSLISQNLILTLWYKTDLLVKVIFFLAVFMVAAVQRSKTVQLRKMLDKYVLEEMYQDILEGSVQLKRVKVLKDRIQVYYQKIKEQHY